MQKQIIATWKQLAAEKKITARNTLTYILLRADGPTEALYHIRKAFSPIKNPVKLNNGRVSYDCLTTNENFGLGCLLKSWASKTNVREGIKARIREFGIEPTEEQVEAFLITYTDCMKKLGF